ncbi:MAG: DUF4381 domain-containing protein [Chlamydiota bacterium]
MNPLLEELHDIEGIDPVNWWPLAIGWWIVFAILSIIVVIAIFYYFRRLAYLRSWKSDALKQLNKLDKNLTEENSRETAESLSEYMRRIALTLYSRKECASLVGDEWLVWLTKHDPQNFDWKSKGKFLIDIPYAPVDRAPPKNKVREVLKAVKGWVK